MKLDGNAVANDSGASGNFVDVPDDFASVDGPAGLRKLGMTGQCVDKICIEPGAVGRCEVGVLRILEVIVERKLSTILRKDEVDAGLPVVSAEQQPRVVNDNRSGTIRNSLCCC